MTKMRQEADGANFLEKRARKDAMTAALQAGHWRAVLNEYDADPDFHEPLLVWIKPSLAMLEFIAAELELMGLRKVLSVGCGCAFLESLLTHATGVTTLGLEVNPGWWQSPYSTPSFIPLTFTVQGLVPALAKDQALLFCYFNALEQFEQYLAAYEGPCVILIGPVNGRRHCEPEPYHLDGHVDWQLKAVHDIRDAGEDVVVVYTRESR